MSNKLLTLCIIHQHPHVLLGMKKRGFGEGRWNGFGGKVGEGETIEEAAKREIREEAGIEAHDLARMGLIYFEFKGDPQILEVHIFRTTSFSGTPVETEEMKPQWFTIDEIPFKNMWPDDMYWFPMLLSGRKFKATFLFDGHDIILSRELHEVTQL